MTRVVSEPVEVQRRDDEPAQFLWRGRLYLIHAVLAHWIESGQWWRQVPVSLDEREREVWRVEAGTGRTAPLGVFDLGFDWSTGRWSVVRVHD